MQQASAVRVGYVLKRYPRYSETFVVNEILAHEAAGLPIEIFALRPVAETHFQDLLAQVRSPVTYVPERVMKAATLWLLVSEARARLPRFWREVERIDEHDVDDLAQAIRVALLAEEKGINHLHAHFGTVSTTVARLAARFAGITYSFTAHAKDIFYSYDEPIHLDRKLRDAARVVTVSDYNACYLRACYGQDAAHVVRVYNGLDLARFPYAEPRARPRAITAVGRLIEKKGFDVLVEACRQLQGRGVDFTCRILGEGPERASLAAQIERSGLSARVELVGPRPLCEVLAELRRTAVAAAPCVVGNDGNRDGLPTILLEAMATGTPCVSTDVTGIPEVVRDGETGLCVPQGDPAALAVALERLLADADLRVRLARAARRMIERDFDLGRNAAQLRALFVAIAGADALRGAA